MFKGKPYVEDGLVTLAKMIDPVFYFAPDGTITYYFDGYDFTKDLSAAQTRCAPFFAYRLSCYRDDILSFQIDNPMQTLNINSVDAQMIDWYLVDDMKLISYYPNVKKPRELWFNIPVTEAMRTALKLDADVVSLYAKFDRMSDEAVADMKFDEYQLLK